MELSIRKRELLKAIIGDYIRSAEPVSSKSLSGKPELPYSPATIRNEMSELEEMGYLEKPHTSAGRIPSPLGYRLYVDELMGAPNIPSDAEEALNQITALKIKELDRIIQEAGRMISALTNYAAVAVTPNRSHTVIRRFELISVDAQNFVIVIVTAAGEVKNKLVHTASEVTKDEADLLSYVLNQTLTGIPLEDITAERFDIVRRAAGLTALLAPVAEFLAELIDELGNQKIYVEGANKLLSFPEYRDTEKAKALLDYISDDKHLLPIRREMDGVQFFIGPENGQNPLSDTSMIYAKYDIGTFGQGMIGIVGPTRMDYAQLSAQLSKFAKGLNKLISENFLNENK